MHFPFSSNISEPSKCELVVGKVGTMFPFIYIQCEEQREGAWQQKGDPRDEPSQSAQYKLAKSTQTMTLLIT